MYQYKYTNDDLNLHHFEFKGTVNVDEVKSFKNDFLKILHEKKLFYFIIDISNINSFDLKFFMSVRNFIDENKELVKSHLGASSIMVSSRYSGILNLLMKLKKTYAPNYITSTIESSIQFLLNIHQEKIGE
tara:strand:- start:335 stop:727 length:393 start_codon:yes stop_codon:yes gene_type:complete